MSQPNVWAPKSLPLLFALNSKLHDAGPVKAEWNRQTRFLATVGMNNIVHIVTRRGEIWYEVMLPQPGTVMSIAWEHEGDILAVMQANVPTVTFVHAREKRISQLDTGIRDPTFMAWSPNAPKLAIGSFKGNLLIYNSYTQKKTIVQNKHRRKITCGAWSNDSRLALGSQDHTISVNDDQGNALQTFILSTDPVQVDFADQKKDDSTSKQRSKEETISLNLGNHSVMFYSLANQGQPPVELAFQSKYGNVKLYKWLGDGYLLVAFSNGTLVYISSHMREVSEELQSVKPHAKRCYDVAASTHLQRTFSVGEDGLRVVDMTNWKEVTQCHRQVFADEGEPTTVSLSLDNQVVTITTSLGYVICLLAKLPNVTAQDPSSLRVAHLSSLTRVNVYDLQPRSLPVKPIALPLVSTTAASLAPAHSPLSTLVTVDVEPAIIAVSGLYLAACANAVCWIYEVPEAKIGGNTNNNTNNNNTPTTNNNNNNEMKSDTINPLLSSLSTVQGPTLPPSSSIVATVTSAIASFTFADAPTSLQISTTHIAALCRGKVYLHSIASIISQSDPQKHHPHYHHLHQLQQQQDRTTRVFPSKGQGLSSPTNTTHNPPSLGSGGSSSTSTSSGGGGGGVGGSSSTGPIVTAISLTQTHLFIGHSDGTLIVFSIDDWQTITEHKHTASIVSIHPTVLSTRCLFRDSSKAFVLMVADGFVAEVPSITTTPEAILWDVSSSSSESIFCVTDTTVSCNVKTYACTPTSATGPRVWPVAATPASTLLPRFQPLMFIGGHLFGIADPLSPPAATLLASHTHCHPLFNASVLRSVLGLPLHPVAIAPTSISTALSSCRPQGSTPIPPLLSSPTGPTIPSTALSIIHASAVGIVQVVSPTNTEVTARELLALGRVREAWVVARSLVMPGSAAAGAAAAAAMSSSSSSSSSSSGVIQEVSSNNTSDVNNNNNNNNNNKGNDNNNSNMNKLPPSTRSLLEDICNAAVLNLDTELAMFIYSCLGNATAALMMKRLSSIEDRELVCGFIALIRGDYSSAQRHFSQSCDPVEALHMRRDLGHGDQALVMATSLAPSLLPDVARECGARLEASGDYQDACIKYKQALSAYDALRKVDDDLIERGKRLVMKDVMKAKNSNNTNINNNINNSSSTSTSSNSDDDIDDIESISLSTLAPLFPTRPGTLAAYLGAPLLPSKHRGGGNFNNNNNNEYNNNNDGRTLAAGGVARTLLRLGHVQEGIEVAKSISSIRVYRECADILEGMRLMHDAAEMHLLAGSIDRAVAIFLQTKSINKADKHIHLVSAPRLHLAYGKAKESLKQYTEAVEAYSRAGDYASVVRVLLTHLRDPTRAFNVARTRKTADCAELVAEFSIEQGDFASAIEFLLIAKREKKALELAKKYNKLSEYAVALGDNGTIEDYLDIAAHYVSLSEYGNAGDAFARAHRYQRAITCYIKAGDDALPRAIDVIRKVHQQRKESGSSSSTSSGSGSGNDGDVDVVPLVRLLHAHLIGDGEDGIVRPARLLFGLYAAVDEWDQAARSAVVMANEDMKMGNYTSAHSILVETHGELRKSGWSIPEALISTLTLLHSYLLVRKIVKMGDHRLAALLLIRVSRSILQFPSHVVPILTSTVVECQRAGMKRTSSEFAVQLARPEYRTQVIEKYRKKIELLARRPESEEEPEVVADCPSCGFGLPLSMLNCPNCHNTSPFCIVTGMHIVTNDLCLCPHCTFPATYTAFCNLLASAENEGCPLCSKPLSPGDLRRLSLIEAQNYIKAGGPLQTNPTANNSSRPSSASASSSSSAEWEQGGLKGWSQGEMKEYTTNDSSHGMTGGGIPYDDFNNIYSGNDENIGSVVPPLSRDFAGPRYAISGPPHLT